MADDNVIDLSTRKACSICGHEPGGHEETCQRHPNHMRAIAAKREAAYASGEKERPQKKRLRLGRRELDDVTESAAEMLYGDRAVAVALLRKQMKSKDEKTAQNAAKLILAYTDGTPIAKIEQTTDNVTTVEYRSAALRHEDDAGGFVPGLEADVGA